jgi:hypothetical protein
VPPHGCVRSSEPCREAAQTGDVSPRHGHQTVTERLNGFWHSEIHYSTLCFISEARQVISLRGCFAALDQRQRCDVDLSQSPELGRLRLWEVEHW